METKSFLKSLDGPTYVHAVRESGFKKCCMRSGKYDGSRRNYFFPRKGTVNLARGDFVSPCAFFPDSANFVSPFSVPDEAGLRVQEKRTAMPRYSSPESETIAKA